ncbi:MAG: cation transporter [Chloroflexota bacterium]|nr:cation transporter [Chloroflexota bacterium]
MKYIYPLLALVPIAFVLEYLVHASPVVIFMVSALALIPLAAVLGKATEEIAVHTGPRIGGLLNATLGNAAELIITIVALNAGLYTLVKASIIGSILGNILVVLGASLLLGGLKNGIQRFDRAEAGVVASLMMLSVIAMAVPTAFARTIEEASLVTLSDEVAAIMLLLYLAYLAYSFFSSPNAEPAAHGSAAGETPRVSPDLVDAGRGAATSSTAAPAQAARLSGSNTTSTTITTSSSRGGSSSAGPGAPTASHAPAQGGHGGHAGGHEAAWSVPVALGVLVVSTLAIVFMSEFIVGAVEHVTESLGWTEFFLGIIIIPLVGNVAEHIVGVQVAYKNQMDLSLAISLGSSLQIALFVAPVLVFVSLFVGPRPMDLVFNTFEMIALIAAVVVGAFVSLDGESNWLEGALLLGVYLILGFAFFYVG